MKMFLAVIPLFVSIVASETIDSERADTTKSKPTVTQVQSVGDMNRGLQQLVDLDADDAFLPSILSTLSEISGYNIVTGPEVNSKQRISVHLKSTPIEEAIDLIVRAVGLSYEVVGNSFLVTDPENLKNEVGLSTYLVQLQYAKATEMSAFLKDLTGRVQVDTSRNALLISTSPKVIADIRNIVKEVDRPSKQIVLRTRIIEVQVDRLREVGIDWERLSKITTIIAERPTDALGQGRSPTLDELGDPDFNELPNKQLYQQMDGLNDIGYYDRQLTAFDITLDFLIKNNWATLLNDTKLATLNNRKASIHIGEVIPFIVRSQESARVERERVGILVEITPQVNEDGFITAHVKPEASTIVEMINDEIPQRKVRTAETTVLVKDRQRIVIAGLLSAEETMEVHTIPFFGDIPFFGKLFQHYRNETRKTDLIIEITPYVLDNMDPYQQMLNDSLTDALEPIEKLRKLQEAGIRTGKDSTGMRPTHYLLQPDVHVLKPFQYTAGFHELSLGCFNDFQITYSPYQSLGGLWWGVKYSLAPSLALGVGYPREDFKGLDERRWGRRLGLYLANQPVSNNWFSWTWMIQTRLADFASYGAGTALAFKTGPVWLMAEAEELYTEKPMGDDLNWSPRVGAAVRFFWPWHQNLSMDIGASLERDTFQSEPFRLQDPRNHTPRLYFDLAYSGFIKETKK